jgi:hypothetical protein
MTVSEEGCCQGGQGSQRAVAPDKKKKKKISETYMFQVANNTESTVQVKSYMNCILMLAFFNVFTEKP